MQLALSSSERLRCTRLDREARSRAEIRQRYVSPSLFLSVHSTFLIRIQPHPPETCAGSVGASLFSRDMETEGLKILIIIFFLFHFHFVSYQSVLQLHLLNSAQLNFATAKGESTCQWILFRAGFRNAPLLLAPQDFLFPVNGSTYFTSRELTFCRYILR